MILPRENKSHSVALYAFLQIFRRELQWNSKLFDHVRASAPRGNAAIPMLHNRDTTRRQDKHDRGRDIKEIEAVSSRSTNVKHGARKFGRVQHGIDCSFQEQLDESGDLFRTLPFFMQRRQERGLL